MNSRGRVELGLHGLFLLMAVVVLGLSLALRTDEQRGIYIPGTAIIMPPTCTSRALYGVECPGCGMTRAFVAISRGQFNRAWELNRASFVVYVFVLAQIPWQTIQIYRRSKGWPPMLWTPIFWIPIGLSVILVVNWMFKLIGW
jgi:hypothetical protein